MHAVRSFAGFGAVDMESSSHSTELPHCMVYHGWRTDPRGARFPPLRLAWSPAHTRTNVQTATETGRQSVGALLFFGVPQLHFIGQVVPGMGGCGGLKDARTGYIRAALCVPLGAAEATQAVLHLSVVQQFWKEALDKEVLVSQVRRHTV